MLVNLSPQLAGLFRSHHVDCGLWGDKLGEHVVFEGTPYLADAGVIRATPHPTYPSVQMDVRFFIGNRVLIESFAGFGADPQARIADAFQNFVRSSFHVLLSAFFRHDNDDQVVRENWLTGKSNSIVTLGNFTGRGTLPVDVLNLDGWFKPVEQLIRSCDFEPGFHWIRLFYAQSAYTPIACEVLFDNEIWTPVREQMAAYPWHAAEMFYSRRVFLILETAAR